MESRIVEITDEASLWTALDEALSHDGDDAPFSVDFSNADWAKIRVVYKGTRYHASLTPSAMKGIVELQASLYKSAALILRNEADARRLTDAEREALELTFKIKGGSSDTEGEGKGFLSKVAEVVSTMTSNHKLIALLVLGGMYFGGQGFKEYLDHKGAHEEKAQLAELNNNVMEHDQKAQELLARSLLQSSEAGRIHEQASNGFDAVVQSAGNVQSVTVQGTTLNQEHIAQIRSTPRRASASVNFNEQFTILSVDTTAEGGFTVKVRSEVTGKVFRASLYDSLASDADRRTIQRAEWKKQKVTLRIVARQLGNELVDARVIRATPVKSQPLLMLEQIRRI